MQPDHPPIPTRLPPGSMQWRASESCALAEEAGEKGEGGGQREGEVKAHVTCIRGCIRKTNEVTFIQKVCIPTCKTATATQPSRSTLAYKRIVQADREPAFHLQAVLYT